MSKTSNPWIKHVKKFAYENGLKYNEALKHRDLREGYMYVDRRTPSKKKSPKKKSSPKSKKYKPSKELLEFLKH